MSKEVVAVEPSATGTTLYLCPLCNKPFDQETSRTRHVQYCRRRAARNHLARPKACNSCRKTKSKCDFGRPCSRCVGKALTCSYGARQGAAAPTALSQSRETATRVPIVGLEGIEAGAQVPESSGASGDPLLAQAEFGSASNTNESQGGHPYQDSPMHIQARSSFMSPSLVESELGLALSPTDNSNLDIDHLLRSGARDYQNIFSNLLSPPGKDGSTPITSLRTPFDAPPSWSPAPMDERSLVPRPNRTINPLTSSGSRRISASCRRFALSIIRTYPLLLTRPHGLPLFIHPVGCGLHFDHRDDSGLDDGSNPTAFAPLRPLAACQGIAHIFVSRNRNASEFIWRTIENERRIILNEMNEYSPGELVAAVQAMCVYTVMRVIDFGTEYFLANPEFIVTMGKLADRFDKICPKASFSRDRLEPRLQWRDWLLRETRIRIFAHCFVMNLVVGWQGGSSFFADLFRLSLPSNKALWAARSTKEWEREYAIFRGSLASGRERLESVGEATLAHMQRGGMSNTGPGGDSRGPEDDVLDDWHAEADGLGMLLAAVIADLS